MKKIYFALLFLILAFSPSHSLSQYEENSPVYYSQTVSIDGHILVTIEVLDIMKTCYDWGIHYGYVVRITSTSITNTPYNMTYNIYLYGADGHSYGTSNILSNTNESNVYTSFNNGFQLSCSDVGIPTGDACHDYCDNFSVWDGNPIDFEIDYWGTSNGTVEDDFVTHLNVDLLDFNVSHKNGANVIEWKVDKNNENTIDYYTIDYSNNGYNWSELGKTTYSISDSYMYLHREYSQENYYRLNSVNFDGEKEFIKIGYIKNNSMSLDYKLYDILGHEVNKNQKGLILKRYSNGVVEKIFN